MSIKWFKHGKWPRWMIGLHYYTIASFILLVVTGVALYLPAVHAKLIRYLTLIYNMHILLGLIFGVTLVTPFLQKLLPKGRRVWRFDWVLPLLFGVPIVVTGLMLWGISVFPTVVRSRAFTWHGILTAVLGGWILIHAFYKALGVRPPADGFAGRVDPERRMFLRWAGAGLLGAAVVTVIDPLSAIARIFSSQRLVGDERATATNGVHRFPAYYTITSGYPEMTLSQYQLRVDGQVSTPMTLRWADIQTLPTFIQTVDFHCVTGWSVSNVTWEGVHISQLMSLVSVQSAAQYVNFYSFDGRDTESLKLSEALDPSVVLAYKMDGQPLRREQGFPLRLVVPKMYGYKSIKWLNRIEFSDKPIVGFWEQNGYPSEAYF